MKLKTVRYFLVVAAVLLATLMVTMIAKGASSWSLVPRTLASPTHAPPPTPTSFPPIPVPTRPAKVGNPVVTTRDQAIEWALFYDSYWTNRKQPLTKEMIAASPAKIVVEPYATRQEAYDVYGGAILNEPGSPTWVVIIKGEVSVEMQGLASKRGFKESDGVTYFISQMDGSLLGIWEGIAQKRSERVP